MKHTNLAKEYNCDARSFSFLYISAERLEESLYVRPRDTA